MNITVHKAKKRYNCDITNKVINIGDNYQRVNSIKYGIFHFHSMLDSYEIEDFIMNNYVLEGIDDNEPAHWDSFEQEVWGGMPDEF